MNRRSQTSNGYRESTHLEPRVAKLEVGMERLTADVSNLAAVVREQGSQMEQEIQKLVVAVTQASGPKKTDWQTIIAGLALIMAIGSAVFWPLNQTVQENKQMVHVIDQKIDDHFQLANHPVGAALVQRLEEQSKSHREIDDQEHQTIRSHFHEEIELLNKQYMTAISSLEAKVNLHNDRIYARVVKVEDTIDQQKNSDLNELRLWRIRAMNGDIQSKAPISTDIIFDPHIGKSPEPNTVSPQHPTK